MKRIILAAAALLASGTIASAETIRFASRPSLSPDGSKIYFSYDGDICSVPVTGGLASTFISLGGNENSPVPSPDGKWIAFSSDIQGNNDVYVVPTGGGQARQLTYHEAGDVPVSWSADSKFVFFETTRGSARKTTYKVAVAGGTPEVMFDGFFNTIVNLVENPKTGEYLFNESMESISFPTRKRYVGDHNPNIKSWNPKSRSYTELTDYIGKDAWPMADKAGNIYYVSDEYNQESNIVKYVKGGKPQQLTTFDKSVQYPAIAADGSAIVFLKDYQINVLDLKSGRTMVPEITVAAGESRSAGRSPTRSLQPQPSRLTARSSHSSSAAASTFPTPRPSTSPSSLSLPTRESTRSSGAATTRRSTTPGPTMVISTSTVSQVTAR